MWQIRSATEHDAAPLAELGESTFRETYDESSSSDVDLYCARCYSPALQRQELRDPMRVTLVAESAGRLIAYAQLHRRSTDGRASEEGQFELSRIYVRRPWQGRGLAQELFRAAVDELRRQGATQLRLCVWERNPRAIRFYEKLGFRRQGEEIFMLGSERQRDLVMTADLTDLRLTPPPSYP